MIDCAVFTPEDDDDTAAACSACGHPACEVCGEKHAVYGGTVCAGCIDLLDDDDQAHERELTDAARIGFEQAGGRAGLARNWDQWMAEGDTTGKRAVEGVGPVRPGEEPTT
jgi:hypothetical protein